MTFYVKYRTQGRRMRWYKIGPWKSPWQPGSARDEAKKVLGEVAAGHDPQAGRESVRREQTVLDVLTTYIAVTGKAKNLKPRTIAEYTRLRDDVIGPKLGRKRASELTPGDVERLHKADLGDKPYLANRVLALIRAAYNAATPTLRFPYNPARGIRSHHERLRDRVLTVDELQRLGSFMRDPDVIQREGVHAVAALAFLILTGRRKDEALRLKWSDLSEDMCLMAVHDHKASRLRGTAYYALSDTTVTLLRSLPRIDGNPYAFPSPVKTGGHFVSIDETWSRICSTAQIQGARIHDLRRTHSTHAANIGVEILSTSKMLGHSSVKVTESVYTRVDAKALRPTAERIASSLEAIMNAQSVANPGCLASG